MTAEVITYRPRSAVRDVGKALGLSLDCVDRLAKLLDLYGDEDNLPLRLKEAGLDPNTPAAKHLLQLATQLLGFPRHLSQHVGGFVITRRLLSEVVPIENAAMPDRTVLERDKDHLCQRGDRARAGQDSRRTAFSRAGHASGHGSCGLHGRRGGSASPRHGRVAPAWTARAFPR